MKKHAGSNQAPNSVVILGPVVPYRGGIAQYTESLWGSLKKNAAVKVYSFSRQYPKFLYPGKTDLVDEPKRVDGVHYTLDSNNPLTWRKTAKAIIDEQPDLVILNWWTLFWQPGFAYIARYIRKKGIKTVFLCHNLVNHKTGGIMGLIDRVMYPLILKMLKQTDGYIVQSSEHELFVKNLNPSATVLKRIHPIYDRFPPANKKQEPRGRLDLLFFGYIRPYKGLPVLMEALRQLKDKDIYMTIVGEPWGDKSELHDQLKSYDVPNVELNLEYVDDNKAANYFARCDAVVLPYLSATGSGVVAAAYHYGKPVVASRVGGLRDAVIEDKTGWLVASNDSTEMAQTFKKLSRNDCRAMKDEIAAFRKKNSWDELASQVMVKFVD